MQFIIIRVIIILDLGMVRKMYLKTKGKKIELKKLESFIARVKSLRFVLDKMDYGVMFPRKHGITTVFFCQRVDIVMTNKEMEVLYVYRNVNSEKYFLPRFRVYNILLLPHDTAGDISKGDVLKIIDKDR